MAKQIKLPADVNKRAKAIVDALTEDKDSKPALSDDEIIRDAAAALGRKGGLKGGKARAKALTKEERVEIARKGAKARWHKNS